MLFNGTATRDEMMEWVIGMYRRENKTRANDENPPKTKVVSIPLGLVISTMFLIIGTKSRDQADDDGPTIYGLEATK